MKFLNLFTFVFGVILLSGLASAVVTESNVAIGGTIDSSGNVVSSGELSGFDVYGFDCTTAGCTASSGDFLSNPGTTGTSRYTITYPTVLNEPKYAFFFVKDGYLPFEKVADYAGDGTAPEFTVNLNKAASCTVPATVALTNVGSGSVDVDVSYTSPISDPSTIGFIPVALQGHYESPVSFTATLSQSGAVVSSMSSTESIQFSTSGLKKLSFTGLADGPYDVAVSVTTTDSRCVASTTTSLTDSFISTGASDTTAPGPVTGLILDSRTTDSLTWSWTNPTDADFSFVRVFIDGTKVIDLGGTTYTASGLTPGSSHTIRLETVDSNGNINAIGVSDTATTLTPPPVDTTAPADATGLAVSGRTETTLDLTWTNPSDTDFSHVIIFRDGVNMGIAPGMPGSQGTFTVTGLTAGTNYNIVIQTVDFSLNVNTPGINIDARTSDAPSTTSGSTDKNDKSKRNKKTVLNTFDERFDVEAENFNHAELNLDALTVGDSETLTVGKAGGSDSGRGVAGWVWTLVLINLFVLLVVVVLVEAKR